MKISSPTQPKSPPPQTHSIQTASRPTTSTFIPPQKSNSSPPLEPATNCRPPPTSPTGSPSASPSKAPARSTANSFPPVTASASSTACRSSSDFSPGSPSRPILSVATASSNLSTPTHQPRQAGVGDFFDLENSMRSKQHDRTSARVDKTLCFDFS